MSIFENAISMWSLRLKLGVIHLQTTYHPWDIEFRLYLAIFSLFLQKLALLGWVFDSDHLNIWKCNINVDFLVVMRGKSPSYNLQFLRYSIFAIISHFQPFLQKKWLFSTGYSTLIISIFENTIEMRTFWLKWGVIHHITIIASLYMKYVFIS